MEKISLFIEAIAIIQKHTVNQEQLIEIEQDQITKHLTKSGRTFLFSDGILSIVEELSSSDWITEIRHNSQLATMIAKTLYRFKYWLGQPQSQREILEQSLCARRAINMAAKHDVDPSCFQSVDYLRKQFANQLPPARGEYTTIKSSHWRNASGQRINQFWEQYSRFWKSNNWYIHSDRYRRNSVNRERAAARGLNCRVEYTAQGSENIIAQPDIIIDGRQIRGKQAIKQSGLTAVNNFLLIDSRSYIPAQRLLKCLAKLNPKTMTDDQLASAIIVHIQIMEMLGFEQICKISLGNNPSLVGCLQLDQLTITRQIGSSFTRMAEKIFDKGQLTTAMIPEVIPFLKVAIKRKPNAQLIESLFTGNPIDQYRMCLSEWLNCDKSEIIWRTGALSEAMIYHGAILHPIAQSAEINLLAQNFFFGARAISSYYSTAPHNISQLLLKMQNSFRESSGLPLQHHTIPISSDIIGSASEGYEQILKSINDMTHNTNALVRQLAFTKFIQAMGHRNRLIHYCPSHYCSDELNILRFNDKQVSGKYIARYPSFASIYKEFAQLSTNNKTHQLTYGGMPWSEFVNRNPNYRTILNGKHTNNQRRSFITMLVNNHVGDYPRGTLTGQGPLLLKSFGIRTIQPPDHYSVMLTKGLEDIEKKFHLPVIARTVCQSVDLSVTCPANSIIDNNDDHEELSLTDRSSFISQEMTSEEMEFSKDIDDALLKYSFNSPRINLLINLCWHLNLPWRNLMRNQAYYSLKSFFRINQLPDTYFLVAFRQFDKGGIGVYPLPIPLKKLSPLIQRVETFHKHNLEWNLCGKSERLTAATTIEHLKELLPQSTLPSSELYRLFLRVTLRRCFLFYNGYFASSLAGLNYRASLNYVSVHDIVRTHYNKAVSLIDLNGNDWQNPLVPAATRASKHKPTTQTTVQRNRKYGFRDLAYKSGIFGDPSTWSDDKMIIFFVQHCPFISHSDAIKMVEKEQIHKLSRTKVPKRFVDAFWPAVIEGRKQLIAKDNSPTQKMTATDYLKLTSKERAKYFASFLAEPSEAEIKSVLENLNLIGTTSDRALWSEARRVYARMYTDGWCTLSKPVRLLSKAEMKQVEQVLIAKIKSKSTNQSLTQELITFYDLAILTGARPDEILSLQLSHIDISDGSIGLFIMKGKTDNAKRVIILRPLEGFENNYQRLNDYLRSCKVKQHEPFTALRKAHHDNITKNTREYMNRNLTEAIESIPELSIPVKNSFSIYSLRHLSAFYRLQECVDRHYWNGNFHPAWACEADQFGHGNFDTTINSYVGTGLNLITFPEARFG